MNLIFLSFDFIRLEVRLESWNGKKNCKKETHKEYKEQMKI
jgi:hypothetical protein